MIKPSELEIKLAAAMTKPLQRHTSLMIQVKRFFTDVNGTIVDKSLVPANLQVAYPFWLFGEFDRLGGYKIAQQINPANENVKFVGTFVNGVNIPPLFATGLNTVKNFLYTGDIINLFTDSLDAPTYYIWIVQSSDSSSLASVSANAIASEHEKVNVIGANYFVYTNGQTVPQFTQTFNLTRIDVLGAYVNHPFPPTSYVQVDNKQNYFITVPLRFTVDQYNLISSYIDFSVDSIRLAIILKKNTLKV